MLGSAKRTSMSTLQQRLHRRRSSKFRTEERKSGVLPADCVYCQRRHVRMCEKRRSKGSPCGQLLRCVEYTVIRKEGEYLPNRETDFWLRLIFYRAAGSLFLR